MDWIKISTAEFSWFMGASCNLHNPLYTFFNNWGKARTESNPPHYVSHIYATNK